MHTARRGARSNWARFTLADCPEDCNRAQPQRSNPLGTENVLPLPLSAIQEITGSATLVATGACVKARPSTVAVLEAHCSHGSARRCARVRYAKKHSSEKEKYSERIWGERVQRLRLFRQCSDSCRGRAYEQYCSDQQVTYRVDRVPDSCCFLEKTLEKI